jgi:hypothetical protein
LAISIRPRKYNYFGLPSICINQFEIEASWWLLLGGIFAFFVPFLLAFAVCVALAVHHCSFSGWKAIDDMSRSPSKDVLSQLFLSSYDARTH